MELGESFFASSRPQLFALLSILTFLQSLTAKKLKSALKYRKIIFLPQVEFGDSFFASFGAKLFALLSMLIFLQSTKAKKIKIIIKIKKNHVLTTNRVKGQFFPFFRSINIFCLIIYIDIFTLFNCKKLKSALK